MRFFLPTVVNLPVLYLAAPNPPQTQQRPSVGPLSRCLVPWQKKWTWKYGVFPLDSSIRSAFAVYSVCKCILKETKWNKNILLIITLHAFLSFSKNIHNIMTMEDPYPHTSVTINWTSLRQLHLIWSSCLRKAFPPRRENLVGFLLLCKKGKRRKSGRNNTFTSPTRLLYWLI